MKKLPVFITVILLFNLIPPVQSYASTLYFSPSSIRLEQDQEFLVSVRLNTEGEEINAVTANFTYPDDQLMINSLTTNNDLLPVLAERTINNGVVKISGGNYIPFTGEHTLATISFKAQANSGTGILNFTPEAAAVRTVDNQNVLTSTQTANFSFSSTDEIILPTTLGLQNPQQPENIADLNRDNEVNVLDVTLLLSKWGSTDPTADLNKNGRVDIFDLSILLSYGEN